MKTCLRRIGCFQKGVIGILWVLAIVVTNMLAVAAFAQPRYQALYSDQAVREARVQALTEESQREKAEAEQWAQERGMPIRFTVGHTIHELMRIEDGRPMYYQTFNVNAAISTAANQVRNTAPYNVNGSSLTVGIWDGGSVRNTHQEFDDRVTIKDGADFIDHATHVAGTIGASGVDPRALGMAPAVNIDSYDWNYGTAEMTARGASAPGQTGRIYLSNHSYGATVGWDWSSTSGNLGWHWSWALTTLKEPRFGFYDSTTQDWDEVTYNAPYYLVVKSAGNDRGDNPDTGDTIYYYEDDEWQSATYDGGINHPKGDGEYENGYDTLSMKSNAKNILTVGAVDDAASGGSRSVAQAAMTFFSGWGPTDDGRIKPDVVGNGVELYSSTAESDTSYDGARSGTSMSSPNVTGSATLLIEYYQALHPDSAMRSSTLKGLTIHTADDLENPGPDYANGWGLMNTKAAADLIMADNIATGGQILEGLLDAAAPTAQYQMYNSDARPLKVTLCWTDPPGTATFVHDDRTPKLVNDLDVRITGPEGTMTYYPYVLDVNNPSAVATTGDNIVDNVEQIVLDSGVAGTYTITISHKGVLANDHQYYSLIISGDMNQFPPCPIEPSATAISSRA